MSHKKTHQTFFPAIQPRCLPDPEGPYLPDRGTKITLVKNINLRAQTAAQRYYIKALRGECPYVVGTGPAGTGKTYAAVVDAIEKLVDGEVEKLILTRPLVNVGEEEVGTLPGDIIEKVSPWCIPLLDIFKEYLGHSQVKMLLERGILEIAPLAFMRGRTLKNAIVLADEAQNCTPEQLKMLLTRIDQTSRIFITGDINQTDRRVGNNGLLDLLCKLEGTNNPFFSITRFERRDVVRHPAIDSILEMYEGPLHALAA